MARKAGNLWRFMRVEEAARFFGVHPQTVYRWVLRGRLPAIKLGGRWFLRSDVLHQWIVQETQRQTHARMAWYPPVKYPERLWHE